MPPPTIVFGLSLISESQLVRARPTAMFAAEITEDTYGPGPTF